MAETRKMKTALISVYHKDGLEDILAKLTEQGVKLLSTGGTQKFIESLGYDCEKVEDVTTYPSILGGRVKTLHPKIFGGILARRDNKGDQEQMKEYDIPAIDLVIVDLYPFEQTVASGASDEEIIEKIDIGGISLIRAGAKNFKGRGHRAQQERISRAAGNPQQEGCPDRNRRPQTAGRARFRREQPLRHRHTQLVCQISAEAVALRR